MKTRVISTLLVLATSSLAWTKDATDGEGKVTAKKGVDIVITGDISLNWVYQDRNVRQTFDELRDGTTAATSGRDWISGRARVRLDVDLKGVNAVLELGTRNVDNGAYLGWAQGTGVSGDNVYVKQAYAEVPHFLTDAVRLKIGAQPVRFVGHPGGEPFFLDISESHSMFAGVTTEGGSVRNMPFPATEEPVGVDLLYSSGSFWNAELFGMKVVDLVSAIGNGDEWISGLVLDAVPPGMENKSKVWGLLTYSHAGTDGATGISLAGSEIWTVGGGGWYNFGNDQIGVMAYGEVYYQWGSLRNSSVYAVSHVDQRASAYNFGARLTTKWGDYNVVADASYTYVSGDKDGTDSRNEAFLSYENVDTLFIIQNNDYGLDIRTNYQGFIGTLSLGNIDLGENRGKLTFTEKVGFLNFVEVPLTPAGAGLLVPGHDNIGTEIDSEARWDYTANLAFKGIVAFLLGSTLTQDVSTDGSTHSIAGLVGFEVHW